MITIDTLHDMSKDLMGDTSPVEALEYISGQNRFIGAAKDRISMQRSRRLDITELLEVAQQMLTPDEHPEARRGVIELIANLLPEHDAARAYVEAVLGA